MSKQLITAALLGLVGIGVAVTQLPIWLAFPFLIAGGVIILIGLIKIALVITVIAVVLVVAVQTGLGAELVELLRMQV